MYIYLWVVRTVFYINKMTWQEKLSVHTIVHFLLYKFDKILIFFNVNNKWTGISRFVMLHACKTQKRTHEDIKSSIRPTTSASQVPITRLVSSIVPTYIYKCAFVLHVIERQTSVDPRLCNVYNIVRVVAYIYCCCSIYIWLVHNNTRYWLYKLYERVFINLITDLRDRDDLTEILPADRDD